MCSGADTRHQLHLSPDCYKPLWRLLINCRPEHIDSITKSVYNCLCKYYNIRTTVAIDDIVDVMLMLTCLRKGVHVKHSNSISNNSVTKVSDLGGDKIMFDIKYIGGTRLSSEETWEESDVNVI